MRIVKNKGEYKNLKEFFKMPGFPTVIVLGPDGVERDRVVGFGGDAARFIAMLEDWAVNKKTLFSLLQTWAKDTTDVEWNYRVAVRYVARYQREFAQRYWNNILKFDPENIAGYTEEAKFHSALYAATEKADPEPLQNFIAKTDNAEYLKTGYVSLIRYYESQGEAKHALQLYAKALEKFPNSVDLLNGCAWFIYEQKLRDEYERGIRLAKRALKLEPKAEYVWDTLAWLYNANGQYKEAVDAMSRALELSPDSDYFKQTLFKMKNDLANSGK